MRQFFILVLALSFSFAARAQAPERITARELSKQIQARGERIRIYNFWATWCAPCVKEMPFFEEFSRANPDIDLVFVSLDLQLDPDPAKVSRFISRRKLTGQVILLDEGDPNSWIDLIEKQWSGALPATLVVNPVNGKRVFEQREFRVGELEAFVDRVR